MRNQHPYYGQDHAHSPKTNDNEPSTEDEEHCPRCGELLPEQALIALCMCPWCGERICEGVV